MNPRNTSRRHFFSSKTHLLRISIAIAFAALVIFPLFAVSSAFRSQKSFPESLAKVGPASKREATQLLNLVAHRQAVFPVTAFLPQGPFVPESVATYAADCTTPKASFAVGETACAKAEGTDLRPGRIYWVNSQGDAVKVDTFSPTSPTATWIVTATGNWKVYLSDFDSLRALALFGASDPQVPAVDLSVWNSVGGAEFLAGGLVEYKVAMINNGPDAASDVVFTQTIPNDAAFVSSSQDGGAVFECTDNTTNTVCTLDSLASGASASFTFIYQLTSGTPAGTLITNSATIASSTGELHAPDNTSSTEATVKGGSAPASCVLDCPNNITTTANTSQNGTAGANVTFSSAEGFGTCGEITSSQASGSFFPVGETTVVVTSSAGGGGCSFTVTVVTEGAPTITCPDDQVATAAAGSSEATVDPGTPTTNPTEGVSVSGVRSDGEALNAPYPVGTTFITWTATASNGLSSSCSQRITVNSDACGTDTEDPTITAPADVEVSTPPNTLGSCGFVVGESQLGTAVANDNCTFNVARTGVPAGNFFPVGTTTITYTVTDSAGNTATDTQTVTVIDDSDPVIEAPADANYVCPSEVPAAHPSQATRGEVLDENGNPLPPGPPIDNCGTPTVTVTESDNGGAGSASNPLVITRVFTATDAAGNSASDTQTITVADGVAPTITAPADASYQCASDVPAGGAGDATASDNCAPPTVAVSDTSNGGAGTSASPLVITRTYTATDAAGNSASDSQTITVIDNTAPTIALTGPNPQVVECHTSYTDPGATATDNCSGSFAATASGSVDADTPGTYTITYNASDAAGNAATPVTRTVTVVDTTPPVITLNGASSVTVECHTSYTDAGATASDTCDANVPVTTSGSVNVNAVGTYTLTYNATDDSGNPAASVTRTVIVVDSTAPTITLTGYAPSTWPPNHKYQTFQLSAFVTGAADSCQTNLGLSNVVIEKVTSDEIENGNGDGNTVNDIVIAADCKSVQLRREREGGGDGRVYTITFKVTDASGNIGRATAQVKVPHNNGSNAVDSGVHYTVNGNCP